MTCMYKYTQADMYSMFRYVVACIKSIIKKNTELFGHTIMLGKLSGDSPNDVSIHAYMFLVSLLVRLRIHYLYSKAV